MEKIAKEMLLFKDGLKGEVCIANASSIADYSRGGWEIVAVYQETVSYSNVQNEYQYINGQNMIVPKTTSDTRETTSFIMRRTEENAIAAARAEVNHCNTLREEAERSLKNMKEDCQRSMDEHTKTRQECERFAKEVGRLNTSIDQLRTTKNKLEADIAKIQTEIGVARMREIVGEKPVVKV